MQTGLRRSTRACVQRQSHNQHPPRQRAAAAAATSSSESASLSDGSSYGSEDNDDTQSWASEEEGEAAEAGPQGSLRRQQSAGRRHAVGNRAFHTNNLPGAAATSDPPPGQTVWQCQQLYSKLVVCESVCTWRSGVRMSSQLCTDLADLHSQGSCAVQVSVEVHPSGWDASEDCRAYILQQQQQQQPGNQQQQQPNTEQPAVEQLQAVGSGPFSATLKLRGSGQVLVSALSHDGELAPYSQHKSPHTVVLQERVPDVAGGPPHFKLHIQPGSPAKPRNHYSQAISPAGQGKGLQVFPGSVTEVAEAGTSSHDHLGTVKLAIPRVLVCSQLPTATTFPLSIAVTATEQQPGAPDRHLGDWEEGHKLYVDHSSSNKVTLRKCKPLAAYQGRRIARLSLLPHQDSYRLTVTFAPAPTIAGPPTPAAAAAVGTLQLHASAAAPATEEAEAAAAAAAATSSIQPHAQTAALTTATAIAAVAAASVPATSTASTRAALSTGARALAVPAAPMLPLPATAALSEVCAAANGRTKQQPPSAQAGSTAAAGGGVGGAGVSAQGHAPAAVAGGLLPCQAGSDPAAAATTSAVLPALLLPLKRPAAELQQPASSAGQGSGSGAATTSVLLNTTAVAATAEAAAGGAAGYKKPRGGRVAKQQQVHGVPPAAVTHLNALLGDPELNEMPPPAGAGRATAQLTVPVGNSLSLSAPVDPAAAGAAAAAGVGVLLVKQELLAGAGASDRLPGPLIPQRLLLPPKQPAGQTLVQNAGGGSGGCSGTPAPAAAAAVGPGAVCIKQEPPAACIDVMDLTGSAAAAAVGPVPVKQEPPADVMDLTADSDGEQQQQQQQHGSCNPQHLHQASAPLQAELPPPPAAAPTTVATLAAAGMVAGAAASPAMLQPPAVSGSQPAAAGPAPGAELFGAAAAPASGTAAEPTLLPAGLRLLPVSSATDMEEQLADLLSLGLRPLLPPERYSRLAKQLGSVFKRHLGGGVSHRQLRTMYVFVQAAVDGGEVGEVVSSLEDRLGRLA